MKHNNQHPFLDSIGMEERITQLDTLLIMSPFIQKATETETLLTNLAMWYTYHCWAISNQCWTLTAQGKTL